MLISLTATVSIPQHEVLLFICTFITELEINFDLEGCDYSKIAEGSTTLDTPIKLQFIRNQNPFTVTLTPTSIGSVETVGLGGFINPQAIPTTSRATAGLF